MQVSTCKYLKQKNLPSTVAVKKVPYGETEKQLIMPYCLAFLDLADCWTEDCGVVNGVNYTVSRSNYSTIGCILLITRRVKTFQIKICGAIPLYSEV